jgi:hypothetical protein
MFSASAPTEAMPAAAMQVWTLEPGADLGKLQRQLDAMDADLEPKLAMREAVAMAIANCTTLPPAAVAVAPPAAGVAGTQQLVPVNNLSPVFTADAAPAAVAVAPPATGVAGTQQLVTVSALPVVSPTGRGQRRRKWQPNSADEKIFATPIARFKPWDHFASGTPRSQRSHWGAHVPGSTKEHQFEEATRYLEILEQDFVDATAKTLFGVPAWGGLLNERRSGKIRLDLVIRIDLEGNVLSSADAQLLDADSTPEQQQTRLNREETRRLRLWPLITSTQEMTRVDKKRTAQKKKQRQQKQQLEAIPWEALTALDGAPDETVDADSTADHMDVEQSA